MKKPTFSKIVHIVFILLLSYNSVAQTLKPFTIRKNVELKGKMLVIGNNILGKDNNPLNDNSVNENISMKYIDIDGDSNTFSSSSAELVAPTQKNGNASTCYRVTYAALYWSAMLQSGSRTDINKVKLKLPGASTYNNITGSVIYDAISTPQIPDNNTPYACYADVTSLLATLPSLAGNYTVADVISSVGTNGSTGLAAGWTLFVIYEDPTLSMKSFTTFDGFAALYDGHFETIPVSGFRTPLSGPVDLQFAYAALEGDKTSKSKLEFGGKEVATPLRGPANNFFNSTIENSWGVSTPRDPSGSNTLGYDTGMLEIKGANPAYIKNNQTSTSFMLQGPSGQADPLFGFMGSYAVDIIAPDIKLTKIVKNSTGTDIGGADVNLGDGLYYEINYQNLGNDNVTGMTMTDVLPKNIIFNYPADLDLSNAGGVTVQSYNPTTRTIIFNVPNTSVEVGDPVFTIRIKAQIVPDCNMLVDACSNEIKNQATATYKGVINTNTFSTDSFSSTGCNFGAATPTNFLVKIDNCKFTQRVVLCNTSVLLTGPNGYDSYVWSRTLGGSSIGTGQTYTATQTGVYYVRATSLSTCLPIDQEVTVVPFGNTVTNPVIPYAQAPYAGSVTTCTINGKLLPNLFLCGANDFRDIKTGITDATSIIWEKLNENGTCPAATSTTICANESASCSWSQVGTGPDYKANTAGQFRLTINYTGGCFSVFYFNVFQNLLNPEVVSKDITCNTQGQITVNGIPASGYEFSLDNGGTGTYQASNIFTNVSAGLHNVYIRQLGVTNACLFRVLNVQILNRIYQVDVNVTQPLCNGGKGSVTIHANNVLPQYYFSIYQGATKVDQVGPINANDYTFSSLNPGTYTVRVWTDDGCDYSQDIVINNPPLFTATAVLTTPLTCTDGLITVNTFNGTSPYRYYVNSTTSFQNTNQITVSNPLPTGGIYNIDVTDSKGCLAKTSITVVATPAPVFTIGTTNVLCYGEATGAIQFNVTSNTGGYTLSYSIDDGLTYSTNPVFSGLAADVVYTPKLRYTLDGVNYCYDTKPTVTLTGPGTALTASAGVSELAGCGPNGEGKIRITNPQGGVPFPAPNYYLYSFDNQASWITSNEAYKMPGTYTVYIKDANGCIFAMPNIIIDPKPAAPTINVADPVYNCNGSANTTATVTNPGGLNYQYGYLLDGNANTNVPPNVFVNIPTGSHTITVTYKLLTVPTYSNLLNEDFGKDAFTYTPTSSPDGSSPGINSAFCWERQVNATKCNADRELRNGEYTVTSSLRNNFYSGWNNPIDHTSGSRATGGRYLAVDAGTVIPNNAVLYRKTIKDIIPNQPIQVRFFATNLLKVGNNQPDASLTVELQNASGGALSSSSTGGIPKTNGWVEYNKTIDPGNNTTLDFVLRLELSQDNGIDFAVDDIQVYQLPKTCITPVDFPFEVPTGKAFTGSVTGSKDITCSGANNGEITIDVQNFDPVYGFDYSINNGTTWINRKTSPFTITGLSANTYTPRLRYSAAGACPLTLTPVTIKNPSPIVVNTTQTPATCFPNGGATIDATGTVGGTGAYTIKLRNNVSPFAETLFPATGILTNVAPGSYTVLVTDANGCTPATNPTITITAPAIPTATIDPTSSLCFDPTASIVVNVAGGVGPYTYTTTLNGGTPSAPSPTFTGPKFTYDATVIGTYSFDVYDAKGCKATTVSQVINDKLTAVTPVTTALDCDVAPANRAVITGTISGGTAPFTVTLISGTGGTLVQPSAGSPTTFTYSTATSGTYNFQIRDANNCLTTTNAIINPLVPITLGSTNVNPKCNGSADGSVQLNPGGGSGSFTYSQDGVTYNNTSLFTGLSAGIAYTFYVKDSNKCTNSITVTLTAPALITANAAITTAYTCDNPATISITSISGGTAPYNYTLNRGGVAVASNTTGIFNNISVAGSYTVTISDSNSCPFTTTPVLNIAALNPPVNPTFSEKPISCKATELTSEVTVSVTGGIGTLKYETIAPSQAIIGQQTSNIFAGLTPGSYTFKITDANNCSVTGVYTVNNVLPVTVNGSVVSNVSCLGSADGKLSFTVGGNSGAFTYVLKNSLNATVPIGQSVVSGNVIDYTGLAADTYTITITNPATGCTATRSLTVAPPPSALALDPTDLTHVTCNGSGSAVINAKGGWGTYSYAVTPTAPAGTPITQSNNTFTNLAAGAYSFTVTDLNGCQVTGTFTINDKVNIVASIGTSDFCYDSTDKATLVVSPNTQTNWVYSINGGATQANGTFANLIPGNYAIRVTDTSTGCYTDLTAQTIASQVSAATAITKNLDCTASPDAIIQVTISNGYPNYSYRVNTNGAGYSGSPIALGAGVTTFNHTTTTGAAAATYSFEITDAKGCIIEVTQNISARVSPTATTTPTNPTCFGGSNGSVLINASLGLAPYTYEYSIDGTTFAPMTSSLYSNATAGDYWFRVTDAKSCTFTTGKITLTAPSQITASTSVTPLTCNTSNLQQAAIITVTASNGTPYAAPDFYRYSYNGGAYVTSNTFSINTASTVTIDVKDANGCIINVPSVTIAPLTPPTALSFSSPAITCSATTTNLKVDVTGGVAPYKYEITAPASAITSVSNINATSHTFNALSPNTYTVKVTDTNGCSVTSTYKVEPVKPITVSGALVANVSCNGGTDGKIKFTIGGDTAGYGYTLTNSLSATIATIPTITPSGTGFVLDYIGLPAETYTLTVTSPTACTVTANVPVSQPSAVNITAINATKVFCSKTISTITVSANGGTSPLAYAVVKQGVPPVAGDYVSTNVFNKDTSVDGLVYDVYVKDKNNCPAPMGTVSVTNDLAPTVTAAGTGCLGAGYTITATPGATVFGTPTYSLNGGAFVATNIFNITTSGDYIITIKDGNGCTAPSNLVTVDPRLTVSAILDKDITCTFNPPFISPGAQITLSPGGGKAPYAYEYSLNGGSYVSFGGPVLQSIATAGNYNFRITDSNSCNVVTTTAIVVTDKVDPVITGLSVPVGKEIKCSGDASASIAIAIDPTKGLAPFVFKVERTAPTYNNYGTQTSGLTAGDYLVTVTDAKGCTDTETIHIDDADPIIVSFTPNDITCVSGTGVSKGSIVVNSVIGGTGNYTYQVSNNNGYASPIVTSDGTTPATFDLIDFGNYQLTIIDANGCSWVKQDIPISSPPSNLDLTVTPSVPACGALGSAEVKVETSLAGPLGFFFAIYKPGITYTVGDPEWLPEDGPNSLKTTIPNLIPGVTYTFIVYDDNTKCYYFKTFTNTVPSGSLLTSGAIAVPITCKGSADGSVNLDIISTYGVNTNVKYEIFNSATLLTTGIVDNGVVNANSTLTILNFGGKPTYSGLPYGTYYVLITETSGPNSGCTITTLPFSITESAIPLAVSASPTKNPSSCVPNSGIITAIAKDGTGPYLYQIFADAGTAGIIDATDKLTTDAAFSATFTSGMTANSFTNLSQGAYIVYAKDAYGCIKETFVSLVNDAVPTIDPLPTAAVCPADLPKSVTVSGTVFAGSSKTYAMGLGLPAVAVAGAYQASPNFVLTASGNYTFFIKDDNGCVATTPYTINDPIIANLKVTKQLDCTGLPNATIHGDISGGLGSGSYSYTVQFGSGPVSASIPITGTAFDYSAAAAAGTYTFVITDGDCSVTEIIDVEPKVPTVFTTSVVDVKCKGDNTGSVSVNVTSGEGPFEYSLAGPVPYGYQDSNQFDLLTAATTYIVTVRSKGNLCEYTLPVTVAEPTLALAVDAPTIVKLSCGPGNVAQAAKVTLNGTAGTGTGTFEYSFDGSAYDTVNVFTVNDNGNTQTIPYKVRDANGCEVLGSVIIDKLDPPVFNLPLFAQTTVTCLAPNSDVTVVSTNGVGTLTYETIAPSPMIVNNGSNPVFTGLTPGDYLFRVTDANGCTDQVSYKVNDVIKIDLQVSSQTDVVCDASATGTATFAVTGFGTGVGTYSVTVNGTAFALVAPNSNTSPTISLTGLAANTYLVRVTDDATGCWSEKSVTINNPTSALISNNTVTPLGCTIKGSVTINATGGWGSYVYTLTTPTGTVITQNTNVFSDLTDTSGAYITSVTDANGCSVPGNFTLLPPVNPTVDNVVVSCTVNNLSTLVVTASSLSTFTYTPFEYSIDNGQTWQASNTFNNVAPGSYDVVVKDAFGCTSTAINTVVEPQLFATAVKTKEIDCSANPNGTIKITATGGYGPYTYKVSTDNGLTFSAIGIAFTNATDTDYSVPVAATAVSYIFEITDSKGCQFITAPAVIMTPPTPVDVLSTDIATTPVDCNIANGTNNNGTITVNLRAVNDNPDYTYALSGSAVRAPQSSNVFTGLAPGTYDVTVTSGRGCSATVTGVVIANPAIVTAMASAPAFSCAVDPTTTVVTVVGGGGTGSFTYSANGTNYIPTNTFDVIDNGAVQNLTYFVKDSNGCVQAAAPVVINPLPKLVSVVAINGPAMDCLNNQQVMNVTITGGSNTPNAFTYQVYQDGVVIAGPIPVVGNTFTYNAPTAGHYYEFEVFDNNTMCSLKSSSYNVAIFNTINVVATTATNVSCNGGNNGSIEINVTGYSGPYTYEILKGGASLVPPLTGSGDSSVTSSLILPQVLAVGNDYTVSVLETAYPSCTTTSNFVVITEPVALDLIPAITVVNQNCNTFGAVITVPITSVTGGTPGYTYAFVPSGTSPTGLFGSSNTATIATSQISPLTDAIDVWVQDAKGCQDVQTVQISRDPMPTITNVSATQCPSATGTYDITVTASSFNGTLEYSLDGNSFQSSNILTVTSPGDYTVTVRDANLCTTTATAPVTILKPLQLLADLTTVPTCLSANGEVTLTAGGGTPASYEYSLGGTTYGASNVFSGLAASVTPYTFYVRDTATGCVKSADVTILLPNTDIDFRLDPTRVTCKGGNDGTITVTLATPTLTVNNNPVYTYTLSGTTDLGVSVNMGPQAVNLFSGLEAGNYTVVVTSGRGCPESQSIRVDEPALMVVPTPTVIPFGCTAGSNAMNFATITVNGVTGGSGTYSIYEFFKGGVSVQRGASNVYTVTDLTGGNYTVTVYDDKGCIGSATVPVITPFIALDKVNVVVNQAISCINPESITVTAVDASGTAIAGVQYTLVDKNASTGVIGGVYPAQTNTTGVFTGLPVANYIITATNPTTGCSILDVHYVNEPNTFELVIDNIVDVSCFGGSNGSAKVTFVDRNTVDGNQAGAFTYRVVDALGNSSASVTTASAGPIDLTNLAAGTYTVIARLTNLPSCEVSKNFTITGPTAELKISETHTPITCVAGNNDGTISATAIGGWPGGYEFALSGPVNVAYSTQSTFTNLTAGLYTVSVRDSKGCLVQTTVTLVNPTPIAATINVDKPLLACFGDTDATITVQQPTGGSGNYKYTLEATYANGTLTLNGPQVSNVFANLGVGSYRVSVSDTWNCSVWTNTVVINQPTEVTASLVQATAQTCQSPATLRLSVAGGTGPYVYSVDPNFGTVSAPFASSVNISVPFTTVPAKYVYYVRDANGCANAVSNSIDVNPLVPLDFTFENSNPYINCFGDNSGKITATAVGGAGNYVYTLLDASGNAILPTPIQLTPGNFTQLAAGSYILRVTSGVDCQISKPITITQPNTALTYTPLVTPVTCNGFGNGKLELTAQGGTGVIKFALSPDLDKFLDSGTFLNLNVGHYQAIIQDVNGCNHVYDFDITEPAPITAVVDPLSIKQELCSGDKTGEFALTVVGGNAPYTASIDGATFVPVPIAATPNRIVFTGLSGGRHLVKIKDANLCESEVEVILDNSVLLDPKESINYDCVNDLPANKVTVTVDSSNNAADVSYSLDSSGVFQSSNVFTNLAPGQHFIMVQHKNGCIDATQTFTIDQIDPLTISLSVGGLNEIVSTVTGGSGVYQFTVNSESVNNESMSSDGKYIYFRSGNYTVTVTDSNGCSISATKYFEFIDIVIPPIFTPNGDGTSDSWKPTNTENYPDIKFVVYDRYGRQVGIFGAGQSWDGKYDGTELPMGDYWYVLKLRHNQDDREFVGHFTLYR